ncbi:MAG: hypothetical protein OXC91_10660 [Rhodobacteraceae bacterium]|nr:hypothetical protein [Paracoccaceae bacterium]
MIDYKPMLEAILFCLIRLGLKSRIATEQINSGEVRLDRIMNPVRESRYSIHDLSRCRSSESDQLHRMNMPFEPGLDFGCRSFGGSPIDEKPIPVLEEKKYHHQRFISDLSGHGIQAHDGNYDTAIRKVRSRAVGFHHTQDIGAQRLCSDYEGFQVWHHDRQMADGFSEDDIEDYPAGELIERMNA